MFGASPSVAAIRLPRAQLATCSFRRFLLRSKSLPLSWKKTSAVPVSLIPNLHASGPGSSKDQLIPAVLPHLDATPTLLARSLIRVFSSMHGLDGDQLKLPARPLTSLNQLSVSGILQTHDVLRSHCPCQGHEGYPMEHGFHPGVGSKSMW